MSKGKICSLTFLIIEFILLKTDLVKLPLNYLVKKAINLAPKKTKKHKSHVL